MRRGCVDVCRLPGGHRWARRPAPTAAEVPFATGVFERATTGGTESAPLFGSAAPARAAQPRQLFEPKLGGPIAAPAFALESLRRYRVAHT